MSMTRTAATLYQLQQLDLELDRVTAEQQAVTNTLQGNARLKRLRSEYHAAEQHAQASLKTQKDAEWTLEDINRRLKAQEQRLFSGAVANAKELQSLQQEVQRLRAQQSRQEDSVLEAIDATEALEEAAQRKQEEVRRAEDAWKQECQSLIARRDQLTIQQQALQTKRESLAANLAQEYILRYNAMRRTKQGRAVSRVEQNSCQWCRVILTPSELQQVRISSELQTCTNCGRILYYDRQ
ncbi:MAG TPA: C4-type zinc ribbon domain-containing protein [Ktedonosporobacter sp.]|nr:C4-type zinc ribbon domain-containing protein [Ktedonosporobacter sp.]